MSTIRIDPKRFKSVTPSPTDAMLADRTRKTLAATLKQQLVYPVQLLGEGQSDEPLEIPAPAMHLLIDILNEMAKGHSVTVVAMQEEISTQQAADLLNVSRPFLVQLLENREIPFRKVGSHRRVKLQDIINYKQKLYHKQVEILDELTAYDQELGLQ